MIKDVWGLVLDFGDVKYTVLLLRGHPRSLNIHSFILKKRCLQIQEITFNITFMYLLGTTRSTYSRHYININGIFIVNHHHTPTFRGTCFHYEISDSFIQNLLKIT